jgi:hypothetical protein
MAATLDPEEWDTCLQKLHRYHMNISEELKQLIIQIRKEMREELVPTAEDRANYGKVVKQSIRGMWVLEYEISDIQKDFATSIGNVDINNLTDDFVEDVMLQSKPLQGILSAIRKRQKTQLEHVKQEYWELIKDLEALKVERPPKPIPKPVEEEKKPEEGEKKSEGEAVAPKEGEEAPPKEPEQQAAPVEAAA